ncbi:MAG: Coq4 family protein [Myxococcota bacterium]|nr:Coq4 family protein [Myxococcota bacterium]
MEQATYQYSSKPSANPFRWLLAAWRVSKDLTNTNEAAIVEIGFSRSRLGRRFSGWRQTTNELSDCPETAAALVRRHRLGPVDLQELGRLPSGTLGRVLAEHCVTRGIDPNLVSIPSSTEVDFVMAHVFETHDLWHVATGWGNDEVGEVGLGGFYLAQLGLPLIAIMLVLVLLNTIARRPTTLRERMDALVAGYQMGKSARPLFGLQWDELWAKSLGDLRSELRLNAGETLGEGIRIAA